MKKQEIISDTLNMVKEQIGICFELCEAFPGLKNTKRGKYFNIVLADRVSESKEYDALERFAKKYNLIAVEPNGANIVAIFIK